MSCESETKDPNPSSLGCEVAVAYAEEFTREVRELEMTQDRRLALVPSAPFDTPNQDDLRDMVENDPELVHEPGFELLAAAVRHRDVNVLEQCAGLREWVERENVLVDKDEIDRLTMPMDWTIVVLTQSMPVVSEDGRRAIVYTSDYAGGLAGASFQTFYERDQDGTWKFIGRRTLSIS
jgi:hypothetical protein